MTDLFQQYKVTITAALEASDAIMEIYAGDFERIEKEDGSPVTIADLTSSKIIGTHLETTGIPITGEEKEKSPYAERQKWNKVWCVDPLDGTKEFIKKNGEFVINIALIENEHPVFGLIASPVNRQIIIGNSVSGAFQMSYENALNPSKWKRLKNLSQTNDPIQLISSRSHYSGNLLKLVESIKEDYGLVELRAMGSALKFFELVNNRADVYPRFAPTMEWDIAAGQAIYEAIGGKVINVNTGKPLVYNKKDLRNPHFIASNSLLNLPFHSFQQ
jgi:3'(2'), 5'-bisphosphate nucleotidase